MNTTLAPELLTRLDQLAAVRHTDRDNLLSEAIRAYLDRAEEQILSDRINAAYTDDPNDEAARREEESLAHSRRFLMRQMPRDYEDEI